MIVTHYDQGSPDWHASRCGIPTASRFADVMSFTEDSWRVVRESGTTVRVFTNKEAARKCAGDKYDVRHEPGQPLKAYQDYVLDIACQRMTNAFCDSEGWSNFWTDRGHELEPAARKFYQFMTGREVTECGLLLTDDRDAGCSADGLVGDDGGIEIKCYKRTKHMEIVLADEVHSDDIHQVHGAMYITGRPWWDYVVFHPDAPIDGHIIRVKRDERYCENLGKQLERFNADVEKKIREIEERSEVREAA